MLLNHLATIKKIHDATSFPLHDFAKTHHGTILNKVVLYVLPRYSLIVDAKSFMTKKCHISKQSYFFGNPFGFHLNLTFGISNQILTHFFHNCLQSVSQLLGERCKDLHKYRLPWSGQRSEFIVPRIGSYSPA